ncbi:MAG: MurT ligase domain-containing protein [Oscillospiraceae bacterium]|nr:MurT ligase domain-containing protein [Oscillospiraceae bacterium]
MGLRGIIAIAVCKILYYIGKQVGKGSSLPGHIALKIYPGVLQNLKLPKNIIAVTGSNGKTSTAELVAHALEKNAMSVGWNHEGSNQTEGVATLLLRMATLCGKVKRDALVLECDERYARKIFAAVRPSALIVTNLCRDQLSRNGHHEFIQDCIRSAIEVCQESVNKTVATGVVSKSQDTRAYAPISATTLVLNADDPYVAALALIKGSNCDTGDKVDETSETMKAMDRAKILWFGVSKQVVSGNSDTLHPSNPYQYDDGAFCPICKGRMTYDYRIAAHYGRYSCSKCGFAHLTPNFEITRIDYQTGATAIELTGATHNCSRPTHGSCPCAIKTRLRFPSLVGAYNLAAAIAAVTTTGICAQDAAQAMDDYELKGGRTITFSVGGQDGTLLISKHENSLSYNQNMALIVSQQKPCTVVVVVDAISRKYYTSETSWLWDIDVGILADDNVKKVVLVGRYVHELLARFSLSEVAQSKIDHVEDLSKLYEYLVKNNAHEIYALTCFSDKAKLLKVLDN